MEVLPLLLLGSLAGTGGLYTMLNAGRESADIVRWMGPTLVATALLPVAAIVTSNSTDWPPSLLEKWYAGAAFAGLALCTIVLSLAVTVLRSQTHAVPSFLGLLLCCAGICCFHGAFLTASILGVASIAAGVVRRLLSERANESRPVQPQDDRPREPMLACLTGAVLATTLVSAVHASVDLQFARQSSEGEVPQAIEFQPIRDDVQARRLEPDVQLAHHSLILAALLVAVGCVGLSTRAEPTAVLCSCGVALLGAMLAFVSFGGLHQQSVGDWFASSMMVVAAVIVLAGRSRLWPVVVASIEDSPRLTAVTGCEASADNSPAQQVSEDSDG